MTGAADNEKVQQIIATNLARLQAEVDQVRAVLDEIEEKANATDLLAAEAVDWDEVPDDISDDTLKALLSKGREFLSLYCKEGFQDKLGAFLKNLAKEDPARVQGIVQSIQIERMQQMALADMPLAPGSLLLQVFTDRPAEEGGAWTFVAVPVVIDEDFKASVPASLPVEMQISLDVKPHAGADASLTDTFNLQAMNVPAGVTPAPAVLVYQPDGDGKKELHVSGYFRNGDELQPVYQIEPFTVGPELPGLDDEDDMRWDGLDDGPFGGGLRP